MKNKQVILQEEVFKAINNEDNRPLVVSIMGQTGVGKSSLINALFDTSLKTDPVKPCTMKIEKVSYRTEGDQELIFCDLPGIGESVAADKTYLKSYLDQIQLSDIVIWAIHADNRSVSFDLQAMDNLLNQLSPDQKTEFLSKIAFVLTKVDLLVPPPWIFGKVSDEQGVFSPSPELGKILEAKKEYYQKTFIEPNAELMVSTTYNDCGFDLQENGFFFDEYTVGFNGFPDKGFFEELNNTYPQYSNVFSRLKQNYEFIPCSSLFRYNLGKLMLIIANKIGEAAAGRLSKFISEKKFNRIGLDKVKTYSNMVVFDLKTQEVLFDLNKVI